MQYSCGTSCRGTYSIFFRYCCFHCSLLLFPPFLMLSHCLFIFSSSDESVSGSCPHFVPFLFHLCKYSLILFSSGALFYNEFKLLHFVYYLNVNSYKDCFMYFLTTNVMYFSVSVWFLYIICFCMHFHCISYYWAHGLEGWMASPPHLLRYSFGLAAFFFTCKFCCTVCTALYK